MTNKITIEKDKFCTMEAEVENIDGNKQLSLHFEDFDDVEKDIAMVVGNCAFIKSDDINVSFYEEGRNVVVVPIKNFVQVAGSKSQKAIQTLVREFEMLNKDYVEGGERTWGKLDVDLAKILSTKKD